MTFKDLASIISKRKLYWNSPDYDPYEEERAKLIEYEKQLTELYIKAYTKRRDNWFARHPENKYFEPTLEERYLDTEPAEWHWHFWEYIKETPEQRYQDEKNPNYGWNHISNVHSIEDPCVEGCRFWPEEGRIDSLEVLSWYKEYQGYDKVRRVWEELPPH
jgi:hypothetical protein